MANNNKNTEPKVEETKVEQPRANNKDSKKDVKPLNIKGGLIVL